MKLFLYFVLMTLAVPLSAQTGIHTASPKATLDVALPPNYVAGSEAGVAFPQLSGDHLDAMTTTHLKTGTLVMVTAPSSSANSPAQSPGLFTFTGTGGWKPLNTNATKFFYPPAIALDTSVENGSVNLYDTYRQQFSTPMVASTGASGSIPIYGPEELEYYVTYYDPSIFSNVAISQNGILTYKVLRPNTSVPTFMNIVFKIK